MNRGASALPGAGSGSNGARRDGSYFSIGEVLGRLRPDFPDVTISKIRFLESEGLVEPERAPSGYRKFTDDDVARLRFVLGAQRDHYLPLRVIKNHLDAVDRGEAPEVGAVRRLAQPTEVVSDADGHPGPETFAWSSQALMTRSDLLEVAGIDDALLAELESYGLVAARGGAGQYDGDAAAIARVAGELSEHGLEPRHLRVFRTAADREVGIVEQLVEPQRRQRGADAQAEAEEASRQLAAAMLKLHTLLVKSRLRSRS